MDQDTRNLVLQPQQPPAPFGDTATQFPSSTPVMPDLHASDAFSSRDVTAAIDARIVSRHSAIRVISDSLACLIGTSLRLLVDPQSVVTLEVMGTGGAQP